MHHAADTTVWTPLKLDVFRQNLKYTLRTLARARGFTLVAVLILALAIGANIGVFSVVNTLLLRPLPFPESHHLVWIAPPPSGCGLSCATYLARLGYDVTVYDRKELPGGLDTYGMAEYKMTQRVSTEEARQVERLGVKFQLKTEVGRDISVAELESKHDGVFLGVGLGETGRLGIPGEELEGVYDALYVIERIKSRRWETVRPRTAHRGRAGRRR